MAQGQILALAEVAPHEAFGSVETTLRTTGRPDRLSSERAKCFCTVPQFTILRSNKERDLCNSNFVFGLCAANTYSAKSRLGLGSLVLCTIQTGCIVVPTRDTRRETRLCVVAKIPRVYSVAENSAPLWPEKAAHPLNLFSTGQGKCWKNPHHRERTSSNTCIKWKSWDSRHNICSWILLRDMPADHLSVSYPIQQVQLYIAVLRHSHCPSIRCSFL